MKLHDLRPNKGATKKRKRVGRGIAAGQGKTSGRGTKGTGARKGGGKRAFHEGGQLSLVRRLPFKRGFNNIFRIEYQEVNLDKLGEQFSKGGDVTPQMLAASGLVRDAEKPVVVLGRGEVAKAFKLSVHRISKSAREKIEKAGGTVDILPLEFTGARATIKLFTRDHIETLRAKRGS